MIKNKVLGLTTLFTVAITLSGTVFALPVEQNQLRIQTGLSKRSGDTSFSTMVAWRKGGSAKHRANGLIFINGFESKKPTSELDVARKAANSLNAGINYDAPKARGAIAKQTENKAEFFVSNREGFDLAYITTRDYSNQKLHYGIPNKSFGSASVNVAIDIVYSAAVEYIDGFAGNGKKEAAGGSISLILDNNTAIEIKTVGKSTKEIEKELAQALGSKGQFSSNPLYPNFVELKSRNYKAFDGGEVQLANLNAKSISIEVNDSGLGVLTKFQFPDIDKPTDVASNVPYVIGFLMAGFFGYVFYTFKIKNKK